MRVKILQNLYLHQALECSHGDQIKSGGGEGGLFHKHIKFKSGFKMIFAELPELAP
jgi:hypothetical protein